MITKSNTPMLVAMALSEKQTSNPGKVFDWLGAVELIKAYDIKNADAGLAEDWSFTADCILQDGKPRPNEDIHAHLSSIWATPVLENTDTGALFECWIWETQAEWGVYSSWPDQALKFMKES